MARVLGAEGHPFVTIPHPISSANDDYILYSAADGIATITLNRPDKANTLRFEMIDGLERSLERANRDDGVNVIVLEGAAVMELINFSYPLEQLDEQV